MADESTVQAGFEQLSDETFNQLMGEAPPANTVTERDLRGSQAPQEDEDEDDIPDPGDQDVPDEDEEDEDEKPQRKPAVKADKGKKAVKEKTAKEVAEDIDEAAEGSNQKEDEVDETTAALLEAKAKGLIERGIWVEFDGMEDFKWTEENYGELAIAQAEHKAKSILDDMVEQTGKYGKQIFDYVKNGGDPEDLLAIFQEAKRIDSFDITKEDGQTALLREYYTKVVGWSDARTSKQLKILADTDGLEDEAKEVKGLMDKHLEKEAGELKKEQERYRAQQAEAEKRFAENITTELRSRNDLTDDEKRRLRDTILKYDQPLPDGRKVNKFTVNFMKLQSDPKLYIDLVRFVEDPAKYKEKIGKKEETKAAKKAWNLVKGNASLSKTTGASSHAKIEKAESKDLVINWKEILQ